MYSIDFWTLLLSLNMFKFSARVYECFARLLESGFFKKDSFTIMHLHRFSSALIKTSNMFKFSVSLRVVRAFVERLLSTLVYS